MTTCMSNRGSGSGLSCASGRSKAMAARAVGGPQWKDDRLAEDCESCGIEFNILVRRHHCRYCGGIFCRVCTQSRQRLVIYGMVQPVRVCVRCNVHVLRCEDFSTAVTRNEIMMVKKMLAEKKYKVNAYTGLFPPLYIACKYGHFDVCKVLLEAQAKVNYSLPETMALAYECSTCGRTSPLMSDEAQRFSEFKCLNCQNSAVITDFSLLDHTGYTALHQAVKRAEQLPLVELLLINRANADAMSRNGHTPLMLAAASGLASYCTMLAQHGANVNALSTKDNQSALHRAAKAASVEVIRVLLQSNADATIRCNDGLTPLDLARLNPHQDAINALS